VGGVEPGDETTVAITMNVGKKVIAKAKEQFGGGDFVRCVSAFCLATNSGLPVSTTPFEGDLLIMDIIVSDDGACNSSTLLSSTNSVSNTATPTASTKNVRMNDGWQMVTSSTNVFANNNGIAATDNSNNNTDDVVLGEVHGADSPVASAPAPDYAPAAAPANTVNNEAVSWSYELQTLADMGFIDTESLLPLLKEHVKVSKKVLLQTRMSPTRVEDMRKNTEGMQHVVTALLGQSSIMRA